MSATKKMTCLGAAFLLSVSLLLSACAPAQQTDIPLLQAQLPSPGEESYQTVTVEEGALVISAVGSLAVAYPHTAQLSYDQSGAQLEQVLVEKGQQVKEGDSLVTLVTQISQAELAELRLQRQQKWDSYLAGKETRLAAIEAAREKARALEGYDLQIANFEIEKLQAQYDAYVFQTTRSVYAIDDQIRALESRGELHVLSAPFDGVIDSVTRLHSGDPVEPQTVLVTMHATDTLLLRAKDTKGMLRYNLPVSVEARADDQSAFFTGRVVVAPNLLPADVSSDLVLIQIDGDITQAQLGNSLSYQAESIVLQEVLTIPKSAILREDDRTYVYVLEDGAVYRKYITAFIGSGVDAWVQEGLSAGQTLSVD